MSAPVCFQRPQQQQGNEGPQLGPERGAQPGLQQHGRQQLHRGRVRRLVRADCILQHRLAQSLAQRLAELHHPVFNHLVSNRETLTDKAC